MLLVECLGWDRLGMHVILFDPCFFLSVVVCFARVYDYVLLRHLYGHVASDMDQSEATGLV